MEKEKKTEEKLNLYQKIQRCRVELQNCNLKKSGKNKFANFEYYELADFIPKVNELFDKYKLFSRFTLFENIATLDIYDTESIKEDGTFESVIFSSPVAEVVIKGSNAIQSLGGANTYMKRYLYLNALEIVESDSFDAVSGKEQKAKGVTFKANGNTEKQVLNLMTRMKDLVIDTNSDMEEILKYYKVKTNTDMTLEQLEDCVKNLELKLQKMTMLRNSGQEVE